MRHKIPKTLTFGSMIIGTAIISGSAPLILVIAISCILVMVAYEVELSEARRGR